MLQPTGQVREAHLQAADGPRRVASRSEIDIHVDVPRVEYDPAGAPPRNRSRGAPQGRTVAVGETGGKLADDRLGEPSADIRRRIEGAREVQKARFEGLWGGPSGNVNLLVNADMPALPAQAHVWGRPRCASTASSMRTAGACP